MSPHRASINGHCRAVCHIFDKHSQLSRSTIAWWWLHDNRQLHDYNINHTAQWQEQLHIITTRATPVSQWQHNGIKTTTIKKWEKPQNQGNNNKMASQQNTHTTNTKHKQMTQTTINKSTITTKMSKSITRRKQQSNTTINKIHNNQ